MTNRATGVFVALALGIASLTGCSDGATSESDPAPVTAAASEDSEPATAAATENGEPDPVRDQRSITVGGMGAEYGAPVRSVVDLGVSAQRPSVTDATAAASAAGAQLIEALVAGGVPVEAIQTTSVWINPINDQYDWTRIVAYEMSLGYTVTMTDIERIGTILGQVVEAGGDTVRASSVRFEADPADLMDAARAAAWDDVTHRAEETARLAGEPLGAVLDAHEKVLITSSQGLMQGGEGDSAGFDIPVAPGVAGVIVLLTVTYGIGG